MEMEDPLSVPESLGYWSAIQGSFKGADYSEQENAQNKVEFKNQRQRLFHRRNEGGNL